jgi:hypothetical protein
MLLYNPFCPDTPGYTLLLLRAQRAGCFNSGLGRRLFSQSSSCVLWLDETSCWKKDDKALTRDRVSRFRTLGWFGFLQFSPALIVYCRLPPTTSVSVVDSRIYREEQEPVDGNSRGLGIPKESDLSLVPHPLHKSIVSESVC